MVVGSGGDYKIPQQCVGDDIVVCDPTPLHREEDTARDCARAVLLHERGVIDHCPVEIQATPDGLMFHSVSNHVILVTQGEILQEQCSDSQSRQLLSVGTFQIEWNGTCFLTTDRWSLSGVISWRLQRTIHHNWNPWDVLDMDLPLLILNRTSTIDIPRLLANPKTVRLNLLPTLTPLSVEPLSPLHYLWLCILIVLIVASIVVVKYRHKLPCKCRQSKDKYMVEKRENKEEKGESEPFRLILQSPTKPEC